MATLLSVNVGMPKDVSWRGPDRAHGRVEEPGRRARGWSVG